MKILPRLLVLAIVSVGITGCYHATVDTGRTPSGQVIRKAWANGFVYGLVPPATVETASQCPNGVAKVETQLSFLNQLVSALTFGIYTPMEILVQCAAGGTAGVDSENVFSLQDATLAGLGGALNAAAERAMETDEAMYVQFEAIQ